jgi:subtilase family serine protease
MLSSSSPLRRAASGILFAAGTLAAAQTPLAVSHVPTIVQNGQAKLLSPMDRAETLHLAISLPLRNQAGLEAWVGVVYKPASPNFHKWLSQPEFEARFGAAPEQFTALLQWARIKGMTVTYQSSNGRIIEVDATVDAIDRAFNVVESMYHDPYLNRDFHAPDREPTTDLPFQLLAVDGIQDSAPAHTHVKKKPASTLPAGVAAPAPGTVPSLSDGSISSGMLGGGTVKSGPVKPMVYGSGPGNVYLPSDMRAAYYGSGNLTGAGQTVGIFSGDGYLTSDLALYYQSTGMTTTVPVVNRLAGGYSGVCYGQSNGTSGTCADDEQILDIVQVQGMAPGLSQILFYEDGSTGNNVELNLMVTDNLAKVITSSWGGGAFGTASDPYFLQMATQGQTYLNATGDDGAFNRYTYDAPSLDVNITQVGGTDLTTTGPGGAWAGEVGWVDSGGGYYVSGMPTASKIAIPTWQSQAGVITSTNKGSTTYRNVPDMAAEANFDNPTTNDGVYEAGYGGTSYATPRVAGYLALANQQALENGLSTLGAVNSSLYAAGLSSSAASIYHDVTSGSNPAYEGSGSYTAVAGYDLVTGWGSPNGAGLINYLAGAPVPDFALAPSAVSIQKAGSSVTTPVPLTTYNSFSGTVTLTATGLPTGVTATTTTGTPSTPPTITLIADNTSTMSTYSVTLTGTSGSLSHTALLPVTVMKRSADDFTITATAVSANQGASGGSTITVTAGAGLVGGIALSVGNLPIGVTASFSSSSTPPDTTTPTNITLTLSPSAAVTPNTYALTVTGTSPGNIVHTVTVPLTVTIPPSLIVNGGFETGAAAPWTFTTQSGTEPVELLSTASGIPPHNGNYFALLEGGSAAGVDVMTQQVAITSGSSKATLGLWYWVLTGETGTTAVDTMTIQLTNTAGAVLTTLGTVSNLNAGGYWAYAGYDVSAYIGQTVIVKITGAQAGTTYTDFLVDDVSLVVK